LTGGGGSWEPVKAGGGDRSGENARKRKRGTVFSATARQEVAEVPASGGEKRARRGGVVPRRELTKGERFLLAPLGNPS